MININTVGSLIDFKWRLDCIYHEKENNYARNTIYNCNFDGCMSISHIWNKGYSTYETANFNIQQARTV